MNLKWNGKPIRPDQLADEMMKSVKKGMVDLATKELRERIGAIRHPETGEFPTIVTLEQSLERFVFRVEGSAQLRALVLDRLSTEEREAIQWEVSKTPRVFLSYAGADRVMAKRLAEAFQANGIDTWWAGWSLELGDSLRQEIDKGLDLCTHFVVLLTPSSLERPWIKEEMDAGLVLHIEGKARFVPLRMGLAHEALPPLLRGKVSTSLDDDANGVIDQLVKTIHGVSKKPALGPRPNVVRDAIDPDYSAAANAIAKVFVERSENAVLGDPSIEVNELAKLTGLGEDDVKDALYELRGLVQESFDLVRAKGELYATFDQRWKYWVPAEDALRIAADLLDDSKKLPSVASEIADLYGWPARRMNAALEFLRSRQLIEDYKTIASGPWAIHWVVKNDATRRFVKSRS